MNDDYIMVAVLFPQHMRLHEDHFGKVGRIKRHAWVSPVTMYTIMYCADVASKMVNIDWLVPITPEGPAADPEDACATTCRYP